ncbi:hypothetical protein [Agrococcus jejuensis]|uniref:Uncharacterized protein n=1 Tax=Agrococcus jejuensis TaxID=399736 RepID=A0A1G8BSZ5_9MICO|nr:hypothetical protein [Agrococcus jejuensis]SDH36345.1 hypothetical protein SAMN04489720_1046 [Agrococcus jejuensis]
MTSAAEWVRSLPRGARPDWDELEAHVLHEHPSILRALGAAGRAVAMGGRGWRVGFGIAVVAVVIVGLAVVWAPLWGAAAIIGDPLGIDPVDGATAVPVAAASMVVTALVQAVLAVRAARRGTSGDGTSATIGIGLVALLVVVGIGLVGERQGVDAWQAWLAVALLGPLACVAHLVVLRLARRRSAPSTVATGAPDDVTVERLVAALPDAERDRLLADRADAVAWLRMQGVVSPGAAAAAAQAPLGRLGRWMADAR